MTKKLKVERTQVFRMKLEAAHLSNIQNSLEKRNT